MSSLIKDPAKLISLGEDTLQCATWENILQHLERRSPPVIPDKFSEIIETKHITSGKDKSFLKDKYTETFDEVISTAETLWFVSLDWDDDAAEELASVLPYCTKLVELILSGNRISQVGAMHLVAAAARCPTLTSMDLTGNPVEGKFCNEIEAMWEEAGKRRENLLLIEGALTRPSHEASESPSSSFEVELQPLSGLRPDQPFLSQAP